jgi:hypothetical protein
VSDDVIVQLEVTGFENAHRAFGRYLEEQGRSFERLGRFTESRGAGGDAEHFIYVVSLAGASLGAAGFASAVGTVAGKDAYEAIKRAVAKMRSHGPPADTRGPNDLLP